MASNARLARVGAFPILIETDYVGSLERLNLASLAGHATAWWISHITVEIIIYEYHLLHAVEPRFRIFVIRHIGRNART